MAHLSRTRPNRWRPLITASLFALAVAAPLSAVGPAAEAESADPLAALSEQAAQYEAADYTADSWASFAAATADAEGLVEQGDATGAEGLAAFQDAADELVMVRGLDTLVADYETRAPGDYTAASWAPFADALTTASDVAGDPAATATEVAAAKTGLQTAAADLEALQGSFATITNDTFWNDTDGNPIYSQGGGVFRFGDTYYWYGVHYRGAESYRENPTRKFDNEVSFVSIPVYSSQDLVNWKFENDVATTGTGLYGWVGRLGVVYNENTGKYVLITQAGSGVAFLQGDSPTDDFTYVTTQGQIEGNPTEGTGDQTVFTDEDGQDYLVYSNAHGRAHAFVSKIRSSDSLHIERAVEVGYNGEGREGNAMFKLDDTYYVAASDLHGWNSSVSHIIESTSGDIQGDYTNEYTLPGTEMDYSHVTQTGFFVTVEGTEQDTVIFAGDRWADFAWNGIGYNQWLPITETGSGLRFHSVSQWEFNAVTGEWRVGPENNYILNPDVQADRIIVSDVTGWSRTGGTVGNVEGGANGSRFALRVNNGSGVRQQMEVPSGDYTLGVYTKGSGRVTVTGADGEAHVLNVPSSSNWAKRELTGIELPAGTATVTVSGGSGNLTADQFSLVRQGEGDGDGDGDSVRYEAEGASASCDGTIDANHAGYSGSGFCNSANATGSAAQFTVEAAEAGAATIQIRYANGASDRGANVVVNGSTVASASFANTGSWDTWVTKTVTVQLNAGSNTIRLAATGSEGLPNIDYIEM
ncbi:carbohydrate-binding protein [Glycomyces arizonensis]|uniref:carbohydrate-binding protein n=1 Tax=Glycomyces arizonensis TaxID=256035 RepID=UPI0003FCC888|nr:carbohydrate-binding protein [Glycomyces arizonensis]